MIELHRTPIFESKTATSFYAIKQIMFVCNLQVITIPTSRATLGDIRSIFLVAAIQALCFSLARCEALYRHVSCCFM